MLAAEINLGPTKVCIYDDECVSKDEVPAILNEIARIVKPNLAAQEMRKKEKETA